MTIGIFGGSFNPVHNGHIALAQALVERHIVDEVWLTLSPLNPLKSHPEELVADSLRLEMLKLACNGIKGLKVCDIELSMPRPSYTIDTLAALSSAYPAHRFRLIIGSDNMLIFDKWKDHKRILQQYKPIVYPRPGYLCKEVIDLPMHDISSTRIREAIQAGRDISSYVPVDVANFIKQHRLYLNHRL